MNKRLSFLIILVIMIIVSQGMASASENVTDIESGEDSDESMADLRVTIENDANSEITDIKPITYKITVESVGGTSKNAYVTIERENLYYINYETNMGNFYEYDDIWEIGDLEPSKQATLTLLTFPFEKHDVSLSANAQSESTDPNPSNNKMTHITPFKNLHSTYKPHSSSKTNQNYRGPQHSYYQASAYSDFRQITKTVNHTINAKLSKKPTANPVILAFIGISVLAGCSLKPNFKSKKEKL